MMAESQDTQLTPECDSDVQSAATVKCEDSSVKGTDSEDVHNLDMMPVKVELSEIVLVEDGPVQGGPSEFVSNHAIKPEPMRDSKKLKMEYGEDSDISLDESLQESNLDSNSDDSRLSHDSEDLDMTELEDDGFEMIDLTLPVEAVLQRYESDANSSVWSNSGSTSTSDSLSVSSDNTVPEPPSAPARSGTRKRRRPSSARTKDIFSEMVQAEVKLMKMRTLFMEEELAAKQEILKKEYLLMEYERKLKQVNLEITQAKIELMHKQVTN